MPDDFCQHGFNRALCNDCITLEEIRERRTQEEVDELKDREQDNG